jgi:hypothetical protein
VDIADSRQSFPRQCGPTSAETFVQDSGKVCKEFMDKADNVSFSAIALVGASFD